MNIKITREQHLKLEKLEYKEFLFGSQLHGIATKDSDYDYVRVIDDSFNENFTTLAEYLPNIHSYQYDGDNEQFVWMTERQFYHNLFSGDGNMIADIVLLSGKFENPLFLCRTYKIIKAYIGVAKRDLKLHGDSEKKKFHALRSLRMAEKLMDGVLPTVENIQYWKEIYSPLPTKEKLVETEQFLRARLNSMLNHKTIDLYPNFKECVDLLQLTADSNNIQQFKYE